MRLRDVVRRGGTLRVVEEQPLFNRLARRKAKAEARHKDKPAKKKKKRKKRNRRTVRRRGGRRR